MLIAISCRLLVMILEKQESENFYGRRVWTNYLNLSMFLWGICRSLVHVLTWSKIIDKYMLRHLIKPGITGWAQVNGYRGETRELWQMERRVEYDVWYIEHWNFWLDIKIIFLTVVNAFRGEKNAF